MALKEREKILVGALLLAGGAAILLTGATAQWDALSAGLQQMEQLKTETQGLEARKTALNAEIASLEKRTDLPKDLIIRQFTPANQAEVIKAMLDQVVHKAVAAGNRLISLEPMEATPVVQAPPAEDKSAQKTDAAPATDASAASGDAATPPPEPALATFGYQLATRGTYQDIQSFLQAMDEYKELVDISGIELVNESGPSRSGNGTAAADTSASRDPNKPIKLIAKVRLVLQPALNQ